MKQHQFSNGSCFVEKFRSFRQKFFFCSVQRVGLNHSNRNYGSLRTWIIGIWQRLNKVTTIQILSLNDFFECRTLIKIRFHLTQFESLFSLKLKLMRLCSCKQTRICRKKVSKKCSWMGKLRRWRRGEGTLIREIPVVLTINSICLWKFVALKLKTIARNCKWDEQPAHSDCMPWTPNAKGLHIWNFVFPSPTKSHAITVPFMVVFTDNSRQFIL